MLNFFKRKPSPESPSAKAAVAAPRPAAPAGKSGLPAEPAPLPEVSEGNLDSDWAAWEDSVAFQNSQMPSGYGELDSVKVRTQPRSENKDEGPDPYSTVRKRG